MHAPKDIPDSSLKELGAHTVENTAELAMFTASLPVVIT